MIPAPMSRPPADLVDVELLATERATLSGVFPVAGFARLRPSLADPSGEARATFSFYRVAGRPAVDGNVEATVALVCQRCLTPVSWPLHSRLELVFVESESGVDDAELPEGLEPAVAPHGRASLAALVEDELLLALPLVARHSDLADCTRAGLTPELLARDEEEGPDEDTVKRPFANLRDLLRK